MKKIFVRLLPLIIFLVIWEALVHDNSTALFYYGSPLKIAQAFWIKTLDGSLWYDTLITTYETIMGFIIGNVLGASIGLLLWFSRPIFDISKPYIIALGSAPVFALSPLLVIWFGIGIPAKIVISVLSTFFVALLQAYNGAANVDERYVEYFKAYKSSKWVTFKKLIVPSSLTWVISAFKLNTGFALLGAFIGEYISSNAGLGHMIVINSGLFNIPIVLLGVIMMSSIALLLNKMVDVIEKPLRRVISRI